MLIPPSPKGSNVNFEEIGLPVESLSENQMLAAMYGTEGYRMSQFCLGTWPNDNFVNQSVVVSGAQRAGPDDEPNEYYRVKVRKFIWGGSPLFFGFAHTSRLLCA